MTLPASFRMRLALALAVGVAALFSPARAEDPAAKAPRFERDVLPILEAHCLKCHGLEARKGGLDLRTPGLMLKGGDSGPVLVKGDADKSLLYRQVATQKMPPGKTKLTEPQVAIVRAWIQEGALADRPDAAAAAPVVSSKDREFWAFRPPERPELPRVEGAARVRTPIDAFVLAKLEAKGLTFAPDADRVTLLRRLSFDLLGLPPSPEEVDAFLADARPGAYERLVDRLLASPHYGERWGRHWLDAAGYADTVGPDNDAEIIRTREGLWRYRDYVIRSFNADKPYDRFLLEQLAGDELDDWRSAALTPEVREHLVATGFLRTAVDNTAEAELNRPLERYQVLHDTLEIVTSNLVGLTFGCARCHDHKFDPIPQEDYYRLMAFLTPAYNPDAWVQPQNRHLDDASAKEKEAINRHNAEIERRVGELNKQLGDLRRPYEQKLVQAKLAAIPEAVRADVQAALATEAGKRSEVQKYLADKLGPLVKVTPEEVAKVLGEADRARVDGLVKEVASLNGQKQTPAKIQALFESGAPPATRLLRRGNHLTPGREVEPGFPAVLCDGNEPAAVPAAPPGSPSSGRRTALARWLTRPDHPLTARVLVNRVWQHHFGEGIVATPDNFGHSGARPTHPELLDWLAAELVRDGWRLKPLHQLLVTSTVYRQAARRPEPAAGEADPEKIDPGNQLLWRARLRRVESEAVRDTVLAVSGTLDRTQGGPPIPLEPRKDGMVVVAEKGLATPTAKWRRSVYLLARRNYQLTLLSVFDQPVVATNCTRRTTSAVPLQALTFMNDAFVLEQADHFAARVEAAAGASRERQIEAAFRLAFARRPTVQEAEGAAALLGRQAQRYRGEKLPAEQAAHKALAGLCQMLLCANEFLYVE
jgi:mono/diheme cytochrome c family protein